MCDTWQALFCALHVARGRSSRNYWYNVHVDEFVPVEVSRRRRRVCVAHTNTVVCTPGSLAAPTHTRGRPGREPQFPKAGQVLVARFPFRLASARNGIGALHAERWGRLLVGGRDGARRRSKVRDPGSQLSTQALRGPRAHRQDRALWPSPHPASSQPGNGGPVEQKEDRPGGVQRRVRPREGPISPPSSYPRPPAHPPASHKSSNHGECRVLCAVL